jgi:hypothetical protein
MSTVASGLSGFGFNDNIIIGSRILVIGVIYIIIEIRIK